jgi:large subunit ribosomal protein L14
LHALDWSDFGFLDLTKQTHDKQIFVAFSTQHLPPQLPSTHTPNMITAQSMVKVIDNSGAAWVKAFIVLGKRKNVAHVGDIFSASVKEVRPADPSQKASKVQRVQKGDVVHGVLVRARKESQRPDGTYVKFDDNACILVNFNKKQGIQPRGTRVLGVVAEELRNKKLMKVLSLAPQIV